MLFSHTFFTAFLFQVLVILCDDGADYGLSSETTVHNFGRLFRDGKFEVGISFSSVSFILNQF